MKKTPLFNQHVKHGAKMVNFGGFNMPIQYEGISIEHKCVRDNVGIFDVSHMGEFCIEGNEAKDFLNFICSNDILKIEVNRAQYNCFINNDGGIVDDLIVYRIEEKKYIFPRTHESISSGQKFFIRFLVQMKTAKSPFEIN